MIKFNVPKGLGLPVSTLIRQTILAEGSHVRIVAFKINNGQELLKSGDIDIVRFSAELQDLEIDFDSITSYPAIREISFNGLLTVGDLRRQGIEVKNCPDDKVILNGLKETKLSLVLNISSSYRTIDENKSLLSGSLSVDSSSYSFLQSRGNTFLVFPKVTSGLYEDKVEIEIHGEDERRLLIESKETILNIFKGIDF